jgi:hypothetical protein
MHLIQPCFLSNEWGGGHDFIFDDSNIDFPNNSFVVKIPQGIADVQVLFDILKDKLDFPVWGDNWNSLDELLRDLSWIKNTNIIIVHEDVPPLKEIWNYVTYIRVLWSGITRYGVPKDVEFHNHLYVVFPKKYRDEIARILENKEF